jgi:hypothetical protein
LLKIGCGNAKKAIAAVFLDFFLYLCTKIDIKQGLT